MIQYLECFYNTHCFKVSSAVKFAYIICESFQFLKLKNISLYRHNENEMEAY